MEPFTAILSTPGDRLRLVTMPPVEGEQLGMLYDLLDCRTAHVTAITHDLDMWADDEALLVASPELNTWATSLCARTVGPMSIYGSVLLTGHHEGSITPLPADLLARLHLDR